MASTERKIMDTPENPHVGTSFDDFLAEEGLLDECQRKALHELSEQEVSTPIERLVRILEAGVIYWIDREVPATGRIDRASGVVVLDSMSQDGITQFYLAGWIHTILPQDEIEFDNACAIVYRIAPSGQKWMSVFGAIECRDEVERISEEYE